MELAARLLEVSEGSLRRLAQRPGPSCSGRPGIGPTKAGRLLAAFELGARTAREERPPVQRIREPEDVIRLFGTRLRDLQVEEFHLLALDSQSQVLREVLITRGLAQQLAGASPRSVPGRHRRGGGRDHRRA